MKYTVHCRWMTSSHTVGLGIYCHNRWRDILRGFTLYCGPLAIVVTQKQRSVFA